MGNPNISVLLATRCRTEFAIKVIHQIGKTTKGFSVELLVAIDEDEESLADIWKESVSLPAHVKTRIDYKEQAEGSPNKAWNRLLPLSTSDIVFIAGDDAVYYDDWLRYALDAHAEKLSGYGMVGINDKMFDGWQLATTPLYDKKFCRDILGGVCFVPHYERYCADNEMFERAVASGHYYFEERSIVEHIPSHVPESNPTKVNRMLYYNKDRSLLDTRRAAGFPRDYSPLI